ncbi:DUF6526 family protein [Paenibacillus sp. sptzw28]|uniref:DUF6526 family protein n=1 Tax=Paenibacillus sp. sptzw28 TaxID=715179 RepID=UPI002161C67A|nr:DUF6526 family protein [Paenibacillus sp. sptzw28]
MGSRVIILQEQNFSTHRRFHPPYHFVLVPLSFIVLVGTVILLINSFNSGEMLWLSVLSFLMSIILVLIVFILRIYPLKVQDRVIRSEQQLRHFVLTGQLLDPSLTLKQITGLRFAGDREFPELCRKAVKERLTGEQIKKLIKEWNGDTNRI